MRHMLMIDVAEDVSKDVPTALGIRLVPVEVAVPSLNMRLLIPRVLIRVRGICCDMPILHMRTDRQFCLLPQMLIIATHRASSTNQFATPAWVASLESALVSLSSMLEVVAKDAFLTGVTDLVAEASTVTVRPLPANASRPVD